MVQDGFAQSKAVYTNPEFDKLAAHHRKVAILPFDLTIRLRPYEHNAISDEQLRELEVAEAGNLQQAMHSYFLEKKARYDFRVNFQDPAHSNALLQKAGIDPFDLYGLTHTELASLLGVDAVITGHFETSKPLSDGASVALGIVFDFWGPTNMGSISVSLNNGYDGELLWKYDKTLGRGLGSDYNDIVDAMMRKSSRKFPYKHL